MEEANLKSAVHACDADAETDLNHERKDKLKDTEWEMGKSQMNKNLLTSAANAMVPDEIHRAQCNQAARRGEYTAAMEKK